MLIGKYLIQIEINGGKEIVIFLMRLKINTATQKAENASATVIPKILPPNKYAYTGKIKICDVREVFPNIITDPVSCAFADFEKRISGFSAPDSVITAPETRTSSPVRIVRNSENFSSPKSEGVYPCGEGAGYAGGITSAAVDGICAAMSFMKKYKNAN